MFTHHCTACERTQLIFLSQLTSVVATEHGTQATFSCWCGATQTSEISLLSTISAPVSPAVAVAV